MKLHSTCYISLLGEECGQELRGAGYSNQMLFGVCTVVHVVSSGTGHSELGGERSTLPHQLWKSEGHSSELQVHGCCPQLKTSR